MNLENNYLIYESALSHKFCDDIIRFGEEQADIKTGLTDDQTEKFRVCFSFFKFQMC
jgi:hypothetical protein